MNHHTDALEKSVIKTLLYYDIFRYPLKADEVYKFLGRNSITADDVLITLGELVRDQKVFQHGELFGLHNEEEIFIRRIRGNISAESHIGLARRKAKLLSHFPFVRAVFASGSLSKGYMDENSDLDFFIVTAPGRLWIARMLIVLYKRVFLFNSHKFFCCNYFIDTENLEIEEKNLFTATELATVLPLFGSAYYEQIMDANTWLFRFFPNYKARPTTNVMDSKPGVFKKTVEFVLKNSFGNWLESRFMTMTSSRWGKLYGRHYEKKDFDVAFKTKRSVSKNHPRHFQEKVIKLYHEKIDWFSTKYNIEFEHVG